MIYESIVGRRTIRKFMQRRIPRELLVRCVDAARMSPSGGNAQPLKYIVVDDEKLLPEVFSTLSWARHIPGYKHAPEEVPVAYIVILLDTKVRDQPGHDVGISAMSISLVAFEAGVSSCMLGSVDREHLRRILRVPEALQIQLVIALGYPLEKSRAVEMKDDDTRYWVDENGVINVPKRRLEDILVWNSY
ncbi:MAG: nitroreductase family protein [Candidatus Bathyarchaeia archaeon]